MKFYLWFIRFVFFRNILDTLSFLSLSSINRTLTVEFKHNWKRIINTYKNTDLKNTFWCASIVCLLISHDHYYININRSFINMSITSKSIDKNKRYAGIKTNDFVSKTRSNETSRANGKFSALFSSIDLFISLSSYSRLG